MDMYMRRQLASLGPATTTGLLADLPCGFGCDVSPPSRRNAPEVKEIQSARSWPSKAVEVQGRFAKSPGYATRGRDSRPSSTLPDGAISPANSNRSPTGKATRAVETNIFVPDREEVQS